LRTREETRTIEADLRETIESLETQLIQRELELQASRSEAIELKTASAETGATYKAELADKIRIVEDLQVKSSGLEQALDRIKSETESLESDLQSAILGLENQLAQWDRERQTSRKEAQKLHLTIANLQNRNSNLRQGLKELHQRLENSREEIEIISAENAAQRDRLAEVEATRRELERRVKTQEKEKAELQRLKDALKNQLGMMQRQIEALSMDADAKENQLVTKDQQLKSMDQAYQELSRQLGQQIKKKDIQISTLEDKMKIRLLDKTLFASGSADVTAAGYRVLNSLASALKKMDGFEIAVAGHSDNMPLGSKIKSVYHDNLGLSVARAAAVSRALKNMGVSPDNLSAIGYSEYRPIADNDTKEGRQQNRRVEIMLEPLR
jgi:chemotaxis protein MotB